MEEMRRDQEQPFLAFSILTHPTIVLSLPSVPSSVKVPINTFDAATSPVRPRSTLSNTDLHSILEEQAPQRVGTETIKAFYLDANVYDEVSTFYEHDAIM